MAPRSPLSRDTSAQEIALPSELLLLAESQWIFTEAELSRTPTVLNGCSEEKEREYRSKGVNFILQVGSMLKLPQITLSTASVFFHRFFMRQLMDMSGKGPGYHFYPIAATCLFLATKVEENCRKIRELVIACVKVAQKDPSKLVDEQDKEFWRWRDIVIQNEDLLMEALCFDFSIEPPYKTLFDLLLRLRAEENKKLRNAAWAFINDSCQTVMCLLFPSRTIAASALYAAAKHCDVSFPDDERGRPWWNMIDVKIEELQRACNFLADIYLPLQASRGRTSAISYERISEDGTDGAEKTRIREGGLEVSPRSGNEETIVFDKSPARSVASDARPGKRKRDEADALTEGHSNGVEGKNINGTMHSAQSNEITNGREKDGQGLGQSSRAGGDEGTNDVGGLVSPCLDDVSEEGEVED